MTKTRTAVFVRAGLSAWLLFAACGVHAQSDVSVSPDFLLVEEGEIVEITVLLSERLAEEVRIGYRIEGFSGFVPRTDVRHPAASTRDYTDVTGGSVTIGAGDTEATIRIRILDDDEIDPAQAGLGVLLADPPAGAGYRLHPSGATTTRLIINEGICDRNERLAEYFLTLIPDTNDCAAVGIRQLFEMTHLLDVPVLDQALRAGDFWNVSLNDLDLSSRLSQDALPQGVFGGTGANRLDLSSNTFTMISPEVFAPSGSLQREVRAALQELYLSNVPLAELPAGIFRDLIALQGLHLPIDAAGEPLLPLDVGFVRVGGKESTTVADLKLTVAQGAPYDITADLSALRATISAGGNPVSQLSITRGKTESEVFTLTRTTDEPGVVTVTLSSPPDTEDCRRPSLQGEKGEDHVCYVGVAFSPARPGFRLGAGAPTLRIKLFLEGALE